MKRTLSVRVEVEVEVEDAAELDLIRRTYAERCAKACDTFMGSPRIIHASTVLRRPESDDETTLGAMLRQGR